MPRPFKKFQLIEEEWGLMHPSFVSAFEIRAYIKQVLKRGPFREMVQDSGHPMYRSIDVVLIDEPAHWSACHPSAPYMHHDTLIFGVSSRQATTLDVIHRLTHYSLGRTRDIDVDEDHRVEFAARYLELVYRYCDYDPDRSYTLKASSSLKKDVKALMVKNRVKTYEHSEEAKVRRDLRAKRRELQATLESLRGDIHGHDGT